MQRVTLTLVLVVLAVGVGNAHADTTTLKEFTADWAEAYQSGKLDKILPYYEDAKTVFAIASSGKRYDGPGGVKKMYEEDFAAYTFDKITPKELKGTEAGDFAWITFRFEAEVTSKSDKAKKLWTSQGTLLLRKSGKGWKIAWEHFSPIEGVPRIQAR